MNENYDYSSIKKLINLADSDWKSEHFLGKRHTAKTKLSIHNW